MFKVDAVLVGRKKRRSFYSIGLNTGATLFFGKFVNLLDSTYRIFPKWVWESKIPSLMSILRLLKDVKYLLRLEMVNVFGTDT